jgi:cytochrome c peroxidase
MRLLLLRLWQTTALALLLVSGAQAASNFVLNESCPPSFEKMDNGSCELRNPYQFSDSLQDMGVGGTKTSLPAYRDGFSPQQIDLGRYLFFDPALSADGPISCASCHHPDQGFSDSRARSIGIHGQEVTRSAPTLGCSF